MALRKCETAHMIYRKNDPKEYSKICHHCSERYGKPNHSKIIDIVRHDTCPTLAMVEQRMGAKKPKNYFDGMI